MIDGVYKILYFKISGTYFPIGCLVDNNFSESVETLGTTVRSNSDGWKTSRATAQEYRLDFNAVLTFSNDPSDVSYRQIQTIKRSRTLVEWKIETTKGGDVDYGSGLITSLSDTSTIGEFITFSGEMEGYGEPLVEPGSIIYEFDVYESDVFE